MRKGGTLMPCDTKMKPKKKASAKAMLASKVSEMFAKSVPSKPIKK